MNGGEVDEIGIQSIDLDVPLYIPGYNLYQTLFWLLTSNGYRIYGDILTGEICRGGGGNSINSIITQNKILDQVSIKM